MNPAFSKFRVSNLIWISVLTLCLISIPNLFADSTTAPGAAKAPVPLATPYPTPVPPPPAKPQQHIVAFDNYSNLVLVQVQVNNAGPLTFALDTAFPSTLIDEQAAKALKLPYIKGSGPAANQPEFVTFNAKIQDVNIKQQVAKVVSLSTLPSMLGIKIDGIFGVDLFKRFGITINYQTLAITFANSRNLPIPDEAISLPITESPKGLTIPVQLAAINGDPSVVYAKIDTGLTDALQLSEDYVRSSPILAPNQPEILAPAGYGESQPGEQIYVTRLGDFKIGHLDFHAPIAIHNNDIEPRPYAATIGGEILRRFTVTFDLQQSKLYLVPNNNLSDPFVFDGSGITLKASGPTLHKYVVTDVRPFAAGADAQLKVGDNITSIDDQPCETLTLADIRAMLTHVGKTYKSTVVSGGKSRVVMLSVKSRI